MKKMKSFLCIGLLSTILVGNVFAGDTAGGGISSFFNNIINAVISLVAADDSCETRQCQTCRPREDGGSGNCRPTR